LRVRTRIPGLTRMLARTQCTPRSTEEGKDRKHQAPAKPTCQPSAAPTAHRLAPASPSTEPFAPRAHRSKTTIYGGPRAPMYPSPSPLHSPTARQTQATSISLAGGPAPYNIQTALLDQTWLPRAQFTSRAGRRADGSDAMGRWSGSDVSTVACVLPEGFAQQSGDCDDHAATAFPNNTEVCDSLDSGPHLQRLVSPTQTMSCANSAHPHRCTVSSVCLRQSDHTERL
jgi:hypothetical protein